MNFDVIGEVHGCLDELLALLSRLGYDLRSGRLMPRADRCPVFVGDLVDREPRVTDTLRLMMQAVQEGAALSVQGHHDHRLVRALRGEAVGPSTSLDVSLRALESQPARFVGAVAAFLSSLPPRLELDGGRRLVVHAGDVPGLEVEQRTLFNLYGGHTGQLDEFGVKERLDWVGSYPGAALVVYGHTPVLPPQWRGRTVNVDTGGVFGGRLSALRYPELKVVAVPAARPSASSSRWRAVLEHAQAKPRLEDVSTSR